MYIHVAIIRGVGMHVHLIAHSQVWLSFMLYDLREGEHTLYMQVNVYGLLVLMLASICVRAHVTLSGA